MSFSHKFLETRVQTQDMQLDLNRLSRLQEMRGVEYFRPNEYYGLDLIFKYWLGIPAEQSLYFAVPHGVEIGDAKNLNLFTGREAVPILIYNHEIGRDIIIDNHIPGWKVQGEHGFLVLLHLLKMHDMSPANKIESREILFFPPHNSSEWKLKDSKFDENVSRALLEQYGSAKRVDISLPSASLRSRRAVIFQKHGFRVVSAGDIRDPKFLNRFVNLVSDYDHILTQTIGSHIFFASAMNKKVTWFGHDNHLEVLVPTKIDSEGNLRQKTQIHPKIHAFIDLVKLGENTHLNALEILGQNFELNRERWLKHQQFGRRMDKCGILIPRGEKWIPAVPTFFRRKLKDFSMTQFKQPN